MKAGNTTRKSWRELTFVQKGLVIMGAATQIGLLAGALWDLAHRPKEQVRGNKIMWSGVSFINYFGPLAYFVFGRKKA